MERASSVESYIEEKSQWSESLLLLRKLFLLTSLEETIKWGMPTYTLGNKNVAGFSAFKSHVAIWFFQGVFLKDPGRHLINAQEGTTKGLRQWRFSDVGEIEKHEISIIEYLEEATQNLKLNFNQLPQYKRREYSDYISQAKREETRQKRLEKIAPMIRQGIGLNDRYKSK